MDGEQFSHVLREKVRESIDYYIEHPAYIEIALKELGVPIDEGTVLSFVYGEVLAKFRRIYLCVEEKYPPSGEEETVAGMVRGRSEEIIDAVQESSG